jgi:putative DNA primase/helicase
MIMSNELPDFKDDTGVIATRFVILQTQESFLGREDTELEGKLCAELSGILNWALVGLQRLLANGQFKPPGGGELNEELSTNASPVKAFVMECCELGRGYKEEAGKLHRAYLSWRERDGAWSWADRMPVNLFSGKLRSAFPGQVDTKRGSRSGGTRKREFTGIRLRKGWSGWSA